MTIHLILTAKVHFFTLLFGRYLFLDACLIIYLLVSSSQNPTMRATIFQWRKKPFAIRHEASITIFSTTFCILFFTKFIARRNDCVITVFLKIAKSVIRVILYLTEPKKVSTSDFYCCHYVTMFNSP